MRRVFVSGVFDLFHVGHLEFLAFAKGQGDHLTVSVGSDATVRALKREPVLCEHDRYLLVSALRCVDAAFICRGEPSRQDCFPYVRSLRPDVWVINDDDPERGAKEALARELRIEIVYNYRPAHTSTTALIRQIQEAAR